MILTKLINKLGNILVSHQHELAKVLLDLFKHVTATALLGLV